MKKRGGAEAPPVGLTYVERVQLGLRGFAVHVLIVGVITLVGLPIATGHGSEGINGTLRGREKRVRLQTDLGGKLPRALSFAVKPGDTGTIFVPAVVREACGHLPRCCHFGAVELAGAAGRGDIGADNALHMNFERLVVHV